MDSRPEEKHGFEHLQKILQALKTNLLEERQALEELDFDRLIAMSKEIPPFMEQLRELIQGEEEGEFSEEEEDDALPALPSELRELLEEVKTMRQENLEKSRQIKEQLAQELQKVEKGKKTLDAYGNPSDQDPGSGGSFLKKKV